MASAPEAMDVETSDQIAVSNQRIASVIRELRYHSEAFSKGFNDLLSYYAPQPAAAPTSEINNTQGRELAANQEPPKQELEQEIAAFRQELKVREEMVGRLEEEKGYLQIQCAENEAKISNLQKIMVRAGRKEEVPMDDDIAAQFYEIKCEIHQLVRNHYGNFMGPKKGFPKGASADCAELCARAKVANCLDRHFFDANAMLFGNEDSTNSPFRRFEMDLHAASINGEFTFQKNMLLDMSLKLDKEDEMKEWRVRTVRAAKLLTAGRRARYPREVATAICGILAPMCHHSRSAQEDREMARQDLQKLCENAYRVALLLRGTRSEYKWEQDRDVLPSLIVNKKDHEVLGTEGPDINARHEISRIVFGGVIRGDRITGRLSDGRTRITQTSVVIGYPIEAE